MERNYPEIIISDEGVTWLDKGQMWMYKNNLEQCDPQIKNGELVDIWKIFWNRFYFFRKSYYSAYFIKKSK